MARKAATGTTQTASTVLSNCWSAAEFDIVPGGR